MDQASSVLREKLASALHDESTPIGVSGSTSVNTRVYSANSVSTSNATFQVNTTRGALMSRRVIIEFPVVVSYGVGGGILSFQSSFAPRQYAAMSAIRQVDLTLNSMDFTSRPAELLTALKRYGMNHDLMLEEAEFLPRPDFQDPDAYCPLYDQAVGNANAGGYNATRLATEGLDRPGAPISVGEYAGVLPFRTDPNRYVETGLGTAAIQRVYTFRCPLFMNDLLDFHKGRTLANVTTLNINVSFMAGLAGLFTNSSVQSSGFTGIAGNALFNDNADVSVALINTMVSVGQVLNTPAAADFKLYIDYYSPPVEIPRSLTYECNRYETYSTTLGALNAGVQSGNVISSDMSFNIVPKCLYVFCKVDPNQRTVLDGECHMRVDSLTINAGPQLIQYTNAQQLRELSLENHLYCPSMREYNGVIKLVYGKDLPLPDSGNGPALVGSPLKSSMSIQAVFTNTSGRNKANLVMYVSAEYPVRVTIAQDSAASVSGLSSMEESELKSSPPNLESMGMDTDHTEIVGGKIHWGKVGHFIKKHFNPKSVHKALQKVDKILDQVDDVVAVGKDLGNRVGGMASSLKGGQIIGGAVHDDKVYVPQRYLKFK